MKTKTMYLLALLALGCSGMVMGQSISVDHVDGVADGGGMMLLDESIMFHIRLAAGPIGNQGMTNGFRIYSPDGATWVSTTMDTTGVIGGAEYDLLWWIGHFRVDGMVSDTIALGASVMYHPIGMPADFDEITHTITIGPIDASHEGKHICIDSAWFPPAGKWKWALPDGAECFPSWDGPHCYTLGCCQLRADIDGNGEGPDIDDVVYLVTYMFQGGPEPLCMSEADIDGNHTVSPDIADLVHLVQYMFQEGPPPVACP